MYIFNPEHDLCLANGNADYVPPASALKFGKDCGKITELFPDCRSLYGDRIFAWGWNGWLKKQLAKKGVHPDLLPSDREIEDIRTLSHRRNAIAASEYIRDNISDDSVLENTMATEITEKEELEKFIRTYGNAVLKAPWSGSGKGIRMIGHGEIRDTDAGWFRRTVSSQGSAIIEKRENPGMEFAMLFRSEMKEIHFEGYSAFLAENGTYAGNILASDKFIADKITEMISPETLDEVKHLLERFLTENIACSYEGYLGIDMYTCRKSGKGRLVACSEINLRMTMGMLARQYWRKCISVGRESENGRFKMCVVYDPAPAGLMKKLTEAEDILTETDGNSNYAVAIFDMNRASKLI